MFGKTTFYFIRERIRILGFVDVMWMLIGLVLLALGFWDLKSRLLIIGIGLCCIGFGCILSGLTKGFMDDQSEHKSITKLGVLSLLIGLLMTGYYVYPYVLH